MFQFVYILFFIGLLTSQAFANIGIPVIGVLYPFELVALIPVIIIEFFVSKKHLKNQVTWKSNLLGVSLANIVSTIVGVPIVWLLLLGLQLLTGIYFPAWLLPLGKNFTWVIWLAVVTILIPCFFMSYWVEHKVFRFSVKKISRNNSPDNYKKAIWKANLASYFFLILVCLFLAYQEIYSGGQGINSGPLADFLERITKIIFPLLEMLINLFLKAWQYIKG